MTTTTENPTIARKDLRGWPRTVADILLHIINDLGVRHRIIDGSHMHLFPPDGVTRPFKVAADRQEKTNVKILTGFVNDFCHERQAEWERRKEEARQDAIQQSRAEAVRRATYIAAQQDAEGKVDVEPPTHLMTPEQAADETFTGEPEAPTSVTEPGEWEPFKNYAGKPSPGIETNGVQFRCTECGYEGDSMPAVRSHRRGHAIPSAMKPNTVEEALAAALQVLQHASTLPLSDLQPEVDRLQAELATVKAENAGLFEMAATAEAERDAAVQRAEEAESKLALLREALKAMD